MSSRPSARSRSSGSTWPYLLVTVPMLVARLRRRWSPERLDPAGGGRLFSMGRLGLPINAIASLWGVCLVVNISWPRPEIYGRDLGPVRGAHTRWVCSPRAGSITRSSSAGGPGHPGRAQAGPLADGPPSASARPIEGTGSAASRPMNESRALLAGPFLVWCAAAGRSTGRGRSNHPASATYGGSGHGQAPGAEASQDQGEGPRASGAGDPPEGPGLVRPRLHGSGTGGVGIIAVLLVRGAARPTSARRSC